MTAKLRNRLVFLQEIVQDLLVQNQTSLTVDEQHDIAELVHSFKAITNPDLPNPEDAILIGEPT